MGSGRTGRKDPRAAPTDKKVGLACIFWPWRLEKFMHCEELEKEYRRSPCGCGAVQHVSVYSGKLGYAIIFAAIAGGNGNCNGSSDRLTGSDPSGCGNCPSERMRILRAPLDWEKYLDSNIERPDRYASWCNLECFLLHFRNLIRAGFASNFGFVRVFA